VTTLASLKARIDELAGQRALLEDQLADALGMHDKANERADDLDQTLRFLQTMEEEWRERFQQGLAAVVSDGLSSVFGRELKAVLETTTHRDATSIELYIEEEGRLREIRGARGGSLIQVLSFLLKLLMLVSARPPLRRVMVLDEPFAMVSAEYRPRVGALLRELSARLGVQFIIVTHEPELVDYADVAYEVRAQGGEAVARMLHCREDV
jgi:DNA repair exonuclease SbcCD ATPase subunit